MSEQLEVANKRWEIRFCGTGGQGLLLSGIILAEGAIMDDRNVSQTQSYGPEARGGASKSDVIVDSEEIDFPKILAPDIILAMSQDACFKYAPSLKQGGILIIDESNVKKFPPIAGKVYSYPITDLARREIGKEITANIVALGILTGFLTGVRKDSIRTAISKRVPIKTVELNLKAFDLGLSQFEQSTTDVLVTV